MQPTQAPQREPVVRAPRSRIIIGAFVAFAIANLIHNNFGLDPAVAPATLLIGLYWWRPKRALLWGAALVIAVPAFSFLKWSALAVPTDVRPFLNHVALFLAGAFALVSVMLSLVTTNSARRHS